MLLLQFTDMSNIHTLGLVKPLVNKRDVGIRHVQLLLQFGKTSSPASLRTINCLHIQSSTIITWDYDPLFATFGR